MHFEKIIHIKPAFDKRSTGHGIHCAEMRFVLKGEHGAVIFLVFTGWYLPETTEWKETCILRSGGYYSSWDAKGAAVSYCSPKPLNEWQKNEGRENCDWLGCTCYGDTGYCMADEPFELLKREGSDGVWKWMEKYYASLFLTAEKANP